MGRSLKFKHFVTILVMTCVVVFLSRSFAQYRSGQQMITELHADMEYSLLRCEHLAYDTDAFMACNTPIFKNYLFNRFSGEISLCLNGQATGIGSQNSYCALLKSDPQLWLSPNISQSSHVQMVIHPLQGQLWHVAQLKTNPAINIMMSEQSLQRVLGKLYAVRDNQLPIMVPVLVLCVLLMAHLLANNTVVPLNNLKRSLQNLKPENLSESENISSPYREFDDFVEVYNQLLKRLNESFTKAKRFSSDAAHELRTPLAILRGHAEELIADAPTGSRIQVRLRSMADEIERVIGISEKLLLLSKADANMLGHDLSDFEFSAFVQNLAEESTHYHPEIQVESEIEPYVVWRCDRSLVEQLVHNLYANAIKYNKPQGWIKFHLHRSGDVMTLEIENSASNIPVDLKEKAFDRFYRGDSSHNRAIDGMGLGLSICKEIASLHHGSLTIEPTPQQTVIVKLQAPLYKRSVSHMTSASSKNQG